MTPNTTLKVVHRPSKNGLIPAILQGIESSQSEYILVMDADFSHPPKLIPKMIDELRNSNCDIVIASRYVKGGSVEGWSLKRRLISKGAIKLSHLVLGIRKVKDPMSGFFICRRNLIGDIKVNSKGYKFLLEILVKATDSAKVKEIPYNFVDRRAGKSKLSSGVVVDYVKSVYYLKRYKQERQKQEQQKLREKTRQYREYITQKRENLSSFLSKAGRFFAVGTSGLILNYMISLLLTNGTLSSLWYVKATLIGITISMISNFFLNKIWTFGDRNFSMRHTVKQLGLFAAICSFGAGLQLALVYLLVESGIIQFNFALILAVAIASANNFLLNKKWTFSEKIWS